MESKKTVNIVMIDKNNLDLPMVCEMLKNIHIPFRITPFFDYSEALSYLIDEETQNPDVLILDSETYHHSNGKYINQIRLNSKLKDIPISILISSEGGKFNFCRLDIPLSCCLARYLKEQPTKIVRLDSIDGEFTTFWLLMTDFRFRKN